jgi:hypothetical protein
LFPLPTCPLQDEDDAATTFFVDHSELLAELHQRQLTLYVLRS